MSKPRDWMPAPGEDKAARGASPRRSGGVARVEDSRKLVTKELVFFAFSFALVGSVASVVFA